MNKFLATVAAIAVALPAATPALAQHHDMPRDSHHDARRGPAKVQPNPFRKGQRFDMRRAPNYRVVDYHQYRRLSAPPRGYHWVRSGNDALLVAIGTGVIASVIANTF